MSISAYVGLPGSGKSYTVVKAVILPALRQGRRVLTNIPMVEAELQKEGLNSNLFQVAHDEFKGDDLWSDLAGGEVIVLDEVWRIWPSGLTQAKASEVHRSALAEHRHRVGADGTAQEIVLVTQDLSQIAAWARALVERTVRTVKLSAVGANTKFRIDIYSGVVTGPQPSERNRVAQEFDKYEPEVYRFYSSAAFSVTGEAGNETTVDRRGTIFGNPFFIGGAIAAGCLLVLGVLLMGNAISAFGGDAAEAKPVLSELPPTEFSADVDEKALSQDAGKPLPTSVAGSPSRPPLSVQCRISGWTKKAKQPTQLYIDCTYGSRKFDSRDCPPVGPENWECVIDGQLVTRWTGRPIGQVAALTHTPLAAAGSEPVRRSVERR